MDDKKQLETLLDEVGSPFEWFQYLFSMLVCNACFQCLFSILVFNMLFLFVLWALNSLTFLVFFFLLQAHQRVLNAELDMEGVNDDKSRVGSMCALCFLTIFSIEIFLNRCFLFGSWFLFELLLFFSDHF